MSKEQFIEQRKQQLETLEQKEQVVLDAVEDGLGLSAVPFINEYGYEEWIVVTPETVFGMKVAEKAMREDLEAL